jgi:hypothetical protein
LPSSAVKPTTLQRRRSAVHFSLAAILLFAAATVASAAANIPSSELPGRDRQRFQEQPLDRFTQPGAQQKGKPLWRWDCEQPKAKRKGKSRAKGKPRC